MDYSLLPFIALPFIILFYVLYVTIHHYYVKWKNKNDSDPVLTRLEEKYKELKNNN